MSNAETRKNSLFLLLSLLAGVLLLIYGSFDFLNNEGGVATLALATAVLLLLNIMHAWIYKRIETNVFFGFALISILFTMLYWHGTADNVHFLWYLAFPGFAVFTLGSKKGGIAMLVMTLPIFGSHFFSNYFSFIFGYDTFFEIRFLGAYAVMSYQAILFNNNAEKIKTDILYTNEVLEKTVAQRTADLAEKVNLLAKEVEIRTEAEAKVSQTLVEKDILFREVHHRTKNNMNVIISLLNLQKRKLSVSNVEGVFQIIADRIHSMAMVHEQLYKSGDVSIINLGEYIKQLIDHVRRSHASPTLEFTLKSTYEEVLIGLEQAVPLGLALNEIVTNVFKHTVPESAHLIMEVGLKLSKVNDIELHISDNGSGLPEQIDFCNASSLGLHLIKILIEDQLDGKIETDSKNGLEYKIIIPTDDHT